MHILLIIFIGMISVILIIVVLMQASKGDGLSGTFGGPAAMGSMFGTRRATDFLSKATWWLGGSLAVLSIIMNLFFLPGQSTQKQRESIIQGSARQHIPQTPALPSQAQSLPQQSTKPAKK